MKSLVEAALTERWARIESGRGLRTPDNTTGKSFNVSSVAPSEIKIQTQGGADIAIKFEAFAATLLYLVEHGHDQRNRCNIASDKDVTKAGPLCRTAREANGVNVMIITYTLPILAEMGLVEIDGSRPNRTWLC